MKEAILDFCEEHKATVEGFLSSGKLDKSYLVTVSGCSAEIINTELKDYLENRGFIVSKISAPWQWTGNALQFSIVILDKSIGPMTYIKYKQKLKELETKKAEIDRQISELTNNYFKAIKNNI